VAPAWLPGGHLQTIWPSLIPPSRVPLSRERWETPDGDFVDVDSCGHEQAPRTAVLFHGLEGSSDSHYARALAGALPAHGYRLAIVHFRGCSGEPNRTPRAYHSGDSDEVDWVLKRFAEPVYAVGVSLGGNALLKWLGERSESTLVKKAVAISAPLDIMAAGEALDRGLNRVLYTRHFLATLTPKALRKLQAFPGLYDAGAVRAARTFRDFDNLVTAPLHGFRDTDDYWTRASSAPLLKSIRVPALLLNAGNDPFLPERELLRATQDRSASVVLDFPRTGGHAGFLAGPFPGTHAWLPQRILQFFNDP
jgi:predicted alpha/beta-fold hydrolase